MSFSELWIFLFSKGTLLCVTVQKKNEAMIIEALFTRVIFPESKILQIFEYFLHNNIFHARQYSLCALTQTPFLRSSVWIHFAYYTWAPFPNFPIKMKNLLERKYIPRGNPAKSRDEKVSVIQLSIPIPSSNKILSTKCLKFQIPKLTYRLTRFQIL